MAWSVVHGDVSKLLGHAKMEGSVAKKRLNFWLALVLYCAVYPELDLADPAKSHRSLVKVRIIAAAAWFVISAGIRSARMRQDAAGCGREWTSKMHGDGIHTHHKKHLDHVTKVGHFE